MNLKQIWVYLQSNTITSNKMKTLKLITIQFENEISQSQISLFRGAVNAVLEGGHSVLFHNHNDDGLRYSYPLIQYKRLNRKAAVVSIAQGTEAIDELLNADTQKMLIGHKIRDFEVAAVKAETFKVEFCPEKQRYKLRGWLPFNSKNYKEYLQKDGLVEQVSFLNQVLTGNILSFLKGIGEFVEEKVVCSITSVSESRIVTLKGVKMMSMDVEFIANLSLPEGIGLGKGVSVGYGVISKIQ